MKKTALTVTLAALFTANVQAAFTPQENNKVGLYLGGQIWQSEASGLFGEKNTLIDFNLEKESQSNFFVAVEHPFPLLPNVRISSTTLDTTGKTTLTQEFSFGDETFSIDNNVNASFNVSYVDYTLYYELFDNGLFSFDLGLTARDFDGAVTVAGERDVVTVIKEEEEDENEVHEAIVTTSTVTTTGKIKPNKIVPMMYVATNISLPLTNLSVFAQGDFLLIDDHSLYDYQVGLSYGLVDSFAVGINLTLGYRVVKMEFEDLNNLYTDLEFKGAFVGMIAHF